MYKESEKIEIYKLSWSISSIVQFEDERVRDINNSVNRIYNNKYE